MAGSRDFEWGRDSGDRTSFSLQDTRGGAVAEAERPSGAVHQREVAIGNLYLGMGFAAQLPHGFQDLGHAATVDRVIVAQAAAIGVERQLPHAGNEITVGNELAA